MSDLAVISNQPLYQKLVRRRIELQSRAKVYHELQQNEDILAEAEKIYDILNKYHLIEE